MEDLIYEVQVVGAMRIQSWEEKNFSQAPPPPGHTLSPPDSPDSSRMTGSDPVSPASSVFSRSITPSQCSSIYSWVARSLTPSPASSIF